MSAVGLSVSAGASQRRRQNEQVLGGQRERHLGKATVVRVIACQRQFDQWWPDFESKLNAFPFVGINCKITSFSSQRRYRPMDDRTKVKAHRSETLQGDFDSGWPIANELRGLCQENLDAERVALVQLAAFDGTVLLIRTCYFPHLPEPLHRLLQSHNIVKIGHGLEKDMKVLRDKHRVIMSTYIDMRLVCLLWPWFVCHYDFEQFGPHSVARFLFKHNDVEPPSPNSHFHMPHLDDSQIQSCASEVNLCVDVSVYCLLRYVGATASVQMQQSVAFGRLLSMFLMKHCDKCFLDARTLAPRILQDVTPIRARRYVNKKMEQMVAKHYDQPSASALRLVSLWAWPLPRQLSELSQMIGRELGSGLPCNCKPLVMLNTNTLLHKQFALTQPDVFDFTRTFLSGQQLHMERTDTGSLSRSVSGGRGRVLRVRFYSVQGVNEAVGADGTGFPMSLANVFEQGRLSDWLLANCEHVQYAANQVVQTLIDRAVWQNGPHAMHPPNTPFTKLKPATLDQTRPECSYLRSLPVVSGSYRASGLRLSFVPPAEWAAEVDPKW